ncbi:phosphoglyceromutase [Planctomycetes bacterium MalM25]|nr:phosphoglyceromutase [Planctomycetes bacterium MalM25]
MILAKHLVPLLLGLSTIASAQPSKHVLMIGIDGAGGRYVQRANTPHLDALAAAGTARYDFYNEGGLVPNPPNPYGASGVNWSTILTGASAANHGVSDNSFAGADFESHPHFFKHVKEFDPDISTVSLVNWTPINTFITPDEYANVEIGFDFGSIVDQDNEVKNQTNLFLTLSDPDVMFLHFDQVDSFGHGNSWGSPQHLAAIERVDGLIGEIVTTLNGRPGVVSGDEDWLVLITADHGAAEGAFNHTADQGPANWEVPFIAAGPSVTPGAPMQPGTLRDLASTALWHLGIDPFLAGLDGTVRGLTVEPPTGVVGDLNGDGVLLGDGTGPAAADDVTTFLDNWLATGSGGVADRYARGDLNFDGRTDLSDWALFNRLDPSMGQAVLARLQGVPEPSACLLLSIAALLALHRRREPA